MLFIEAVLLLHFSLDQRSKETTFVHQIFGGYLRSQGWLCGLGVIFYLSGY